MKYLQKYYDENLLIVSRYGQLLLLSTSESSFWISTSSSDEYDSTSAVLSTASMLDFLESRCESLTSSVFFLFNVFYKMQL